MIVVLNGKKVNLKPEDSLGVGGEGEVFAWGKYAIKIYHKMNPALSGTLKQQWRFAHKLKLKKIANFPKMPPEVIAPLQVVTNSKGAIIGYVMDIVENATDIIRLSQRKYRKINNVDLNYVVDIFKNVQQITKKIHSKQVVVGDYNSLNILFRGKDVFFIDSESMQFSGYPCIVATETYLDPIFYGKDFTKQAWFNCNSDWYSYAVMLFQSLLFIHPYGGVHKGYNNMMRRAEASVSVFNTDVKYPKKALPFSILPDDLLHNFSLLFDKGERFAFPVDVLNRLKFVQCNSCGGFHTKPICPLCQAKSPVKREADKISGDCKCSTIFSTQGQIIQADLQKGKLRYIYLEKGVVKRETGSTVFTQKLSSDYHFGINQSKTFIGKGKDVAIIEYESVAGRTKTGTLRNKNIFKTNADHYFTVSGGNLAMDDSVVIGSILKNQTWFKVGAKFGFGFYRVGGRTVYFIFKFHKMGLDDSIKIPSIQGKLLGADCIFSDDYVLFTMSEEISGKVYNSMYLINDKGETLASLKEEASSSNILKNIYGKTLGGTSVLTATDNGLLLAKLEHGTFVENKLFSSTSSFVDEDTELINCPEGIYAIVNKTILLLVFK